jgi:hypothetical protein
MGQYLATGIVTQINLLRNKDLTEEQLKEIKEQLSKQVNLEKYETLEGGCSFEIKDDCLWNGFPAFLRDQYAVYTQDRIDPEILVTLDQIEALGSGIELKGFLEDDLGAYVLRYAKAVDSFRIPGCYNEISVKIEIAMFFMDGKILMECGDQIFHYFTHYIQRQKNLYPIADCARVMLIG